MATLTIEGLPDQLLARLIGRAVAHGRCLNSEVIISLARAVATERAQAEETPPVFAQGCRPRPVPALIDMRD